MGISGAAYATGIGQVISLLVYIIVYFARPIPVKIERKSLKPDFKLLKRLYGIGIPATLNMALPSFFNICVKRNPRRIFRQICTLYLGVYYKTFRHLSILVQMELYRESDHLLDTTMEQVNISV